MRATLVWDYDSGSANRFCRADDGAEISSICQVVAHNHKCATVVFGSIAFCSVDNIPNSLVGERLGFGHYTLMASSGTFAIELSSRYVDDWDFALARFPQNVVHHRIALCVICKQDLLEGYVRLHRFDDRSLSFDVLCHVLSSLESMSHWD